MPLGAGQIIAKAAYISTSSATVALCYAGQSPSNVQTYVAEQHSTIQVQLIASGLVTVQVTGIVIGTDTVPALGFIS